MATMFPSGVRLLAGPAQIAREERENESIRTLRDDAFLLARFELADDRAKIVQEGATAVELAAWRKTSLQRITGLRQDFLRTAGKITPTRPPLMPADLIPDGTSDLSKSILGLTAEIRKSRIDILDRISKMPAEDSRIQIQTWHRENVARMKSSRSMEEQVAKTASPSMVPPTPVSVENMSPELKAVLSQHREFEKSRREFMNALPSDNVIGRASSEKEWLKSNRQSLSVLKIRPSIFLRHSTRP